jgi:hypothetical protein
VVGLGAAKAVGLPSLALAGRFTAAAGLGELKMNGHVTHVVCYHRRLQYFTRYFVVVVVVVVTVIIEERWGTLY